MKCHFVSKCDGSASPARLRQNVEHEVVERLRIAFNAGHDDEVRVLVRVDLRVVALEHRDVVGVDTVVRLNVLACVALAEVVDAPELAVEENENRRVGHRVDVQVPARCLHIRVTDVRHSAVVAGVPDEETRKFGNALALGVDRVAVERVEIELVFVAARLVEFLAEEKLERLHWRA